MADAPRNVPKSKRRIINAFMELRAKNDIEKITVIELCRKAEVNKSTFYVYYHDVYDLSEQLEAETVENILDSIEQSERAFEDPVLFTKRLSEAYDAKRHLIDIIFSGSRRNELPKMVEKSVSEFLYSIRPEYKEDTEKIVELSYIIYGSYYAYTNNKHLDQSTVIDVVASMTGKLV